LVHFQDNEKGMRALKTYTKLMRAAESLSARAHRHLSSAGLTISQFGVLEALHYLGPLSQKDIGQKILRSSGNITMVIDKLEKRKLVRRRRDVRDRRSIIVHLTDSGKKLVRRIFPPHAAVITGEMSALTAVEQEKLCDLCEKLGLRNKA
jgi:MarR family 2-MHQ and catechol resistance regulon transcriptional repressor